MGGFEHVEHTADVGIHAWDVTREGCFEQATLGLLDIMGALGPGTGEPVEIRQTARDAGGVLVDWLSEVLYVVDSRDAVVTGVDVEEVTDSSARGAIDIAARGDETLEGTAVKAITYYQLIIEPTEGGWHCRFFVDV